MALVAMFAAVAATTAVAAVGESTCPRAIPLAMLTMRGFLLFLQFLLVGSFGPAKRRYFCVLHFPVQRLALYLIRQIKLSRDYYVTILADATCLQFSFCKTERA